MTQELDALISEVANRSATEKHSQTPFIAGETSVPVTGKVFGAPEIEAAIQASTDFGSHQDPTQRSLKVGLQKLLVCATPSWSIRALQPIS